MEQVSSIVVDSASQRLLMHEPDEARPPSAARRSPSRSSLICHPVLTRGTPLTESPHQSRPTSPAHSPARIRYRSHSTLSESHYRRFSAALPSDCFAPNPLSPSPKRSSLPPSNQDEPEPELAPVPQPELVDIDHADLLEVIDPAVQAASTLAHIQNSLFLPAALNRFRDSVAVPPLTSSRSKGEFTTNAINGTQTCPQSPPHSRRPSVLRESRCHLDRHILDLYQRPPSQHDPRACMAEVKTQKNPPRGGHLHGLLVKSKLSRILNGIVAFVCTPMGILFAIYGFLVVFWGAALMLILLKWIKIPDQHQYHIWVEICSQILNGLFTIPGLGLLPGRLIDMYHIFTILSYARKVWSLDKGHLREAHDEALDKNDLFLVLDEAELSASESQSHISQNPAEGRTSCSNRFLKPAETSRLTRCMEKLNISQTWYRYQSSPTHRAFPIYGACLILTLNLGNSIFQMALCIVMWGLKYSVRPAWTTATFMTASFSCGLSSAILIWRIGARTRKSEQVLTSMSHAIRGTDDEAEQDGPNGGQPFQGATNGTFSGRGPEEADGARAASRGRDSRGIGESHKLKEKDLDDASETSETRVQNIIHEEDEEEEEDHYDKDGGDRDGDQIGFRNRQLLSSRMRLVDTLPSHSRE